MTDRDLDRIVEDISLRHGGASVRVSRPEALFGCREVQVRNGPTYRIDESGRVDERAPYGNWVLAEDWDPEEARG